MRNRYLDLQRKKMKEFKKHLCKTKFSQTNYEEKPKTNYEEKSKTSTNNKKENILKKKNKFDKGLIVKIALSECNVDPKKLKVSLF